MAAGAGTVYAADFNEAQTQYEVAVQSARQSHINLAKQVKAVQKTDKIPAGQLLGKDHDLVSRMDSAMLGAKGQLKENIAHNPDAGRMSISQIRELTETIKNQDSANISSSSMLNRLDSYIKESQHYKQLDDARGKVKDSIGKASQLLETSKDNLTSSPRFKPGDSSYCFAVGEVLVSKRPPRIRVQRFRWSYVPVRPGCRPRPTGFPT